jgi:hypothetical protein
LVQWEQIFDGANTSIGKSSKQINVTVDKRPNYNPELTTPFSVGCLKQKTAGGRHGIWTRIVALAAWNTAADHHSAGDFHAPLETQQHRPPAGPFRFESGSTDRKLSMRRLAVTVV